MFSPNIPFISQKLTIERKMAQDNQWANSNPIHILEQGLLPWCRRCGHTINLIAGGYTIKEPSIHPYSGGVMQLDWVQGNLQESPIVLDRYFKELKQPWVWWSDKRHEPLDIAQRLRWLGLQPIDRVWAMSFDTAKLKAHVRPDKFHFTVAREVKDLEGFFQIFRLSQGLSPAFTEICLHRLRNMGCEEGILHHTAFYKGKAVAAGTFYRFVDHGLIMHMGVHPSARGKGIGTLLMEELIACAYAYRLPHVFAFVPNSSKPFFESQGFESKLTFDIYASPVILDRLQKAPEFNFSDDMSSATKHESATLEQEIGQPSQV